MEQQLPTKPAATQLSNPTSCDLLDPIADSIADLPTGQQLPTLGGWESLELSENRHELASYCPDDLPTDKLPDTSKIVRRTCLHYRAEYDTMNPVQQPAAPSN